MKTNDPNQSSSVASYIKKLIFLFGLVYFAQGLGQASGLVSQPLNFFFKESLGLNPAQVTEFLAVLTIPWMIKPLYGLLSDFIPLFGYRRKTWLLAMNGLAAGGFIWLSGLTDPHTIVTALLLTAFGTASSDVIIDALMVENGQKYGMTAKFQSVQWLWINVASIGTSLAGGFLCSKFTPGTALHIAAMVTFAAPLAVAVTSWLVIKEEKARINLGELKATTSSLFSAFKSKTLWAVILFLAFWNFSPSFGTPMYYHQVDKLGFSQEFIGTLGAIGAVGSVLGAWLYGKFFAKRTLKFQLVFSIIGGTVGTLAYLLLISPAGLTLAGITVSAAAIAIALNFVFGAIGIIATLTTLTLAAQACPKKAEGFTFAALMSVYNGFAQLSAIVGARLFVDYFHSNLAPLIWVSAGFTFCCFLLLPTLRGVKEAADDDGDGDGEGGNAN